MFFVQGIQYLLSGKIYLQIETVMNYQYTRAKFEKEEFKTCFPSFIYSSAMLEIKMNVLFLNYLRVLDIEKRYAPSLHSASQKNVENWH
jgi:hypothetical protein